MNNNNKDWRSFALLLIDVQNDFWPESTASAFPDFPANIAHLLKISRTAGIEVIHLRASFKADKSDWMIRYKTIDRRLPCIEGTDGVNILSCASEEPGEKIIIKHTFDGFCNPELDEYLRSQNKSFVLVAGLVTSVCVLLTAASAAQQGYLVGLVEDCCADEISAHDMVLERYPFIFDRVTSGTLLSKHKDWIQNLAEVDLV